MYKLVHVYEGDKLLGEVEVYPQNQQQQIQQQIQQNHQNHVVLGDVDKEIRISHCSPPSERCPPLAVLHTITSNGVCFKMESPKSLSQDSPLFLLYSTLLRENKTAVMSFGGEELHLVAMHSRRNNGLHPCFWGFSVAPGLYDSCLVMLNLRCLGIVFDLDETLIVANTMRSFEDKIEALQRKISSEADPQRVSGMLAEVNRYQDDKMILKQYAENDQVVENGKVFNSQSEVVPALSDNHQPISRPLIRLQDRNIILTRINPQIRDTSVLVRLRPAWEELRSYLTARGRKRFEVYVCTMAERDYALEMWRLLDPESNLISSKELLDRIVSVKSGSRKSLFNVFQDRNCHPRMALVIDDRIKVWEENDQPRVHVVPAFAPYYAPQAEANNAIPILCVARNVACNVRGGFFKEFDEGLLQRISEFAYEDDVKDIPSPPDVSNYLFSEDDPSAALNGNKDPLSFDGTADAEVERRLKDAIAASLTAPLAINNLDPRLVSSIQHTIACSSTLIPPPTIQGPLVPFLGKHMPQVTPVLKPLTQVGHPETSLHSSPAREEGEVPESELDPDTRRRLLILQHGQDTRDHPPSEPQFSVQQPMPVSVSQAQPRANWFSVEDEISPRQLNRVEPPKEFPINSEPIHIEKHRPHHPPFIHKMVGSMPSDRVVVESQRITKEALRRDDWLRSNHSVPSYTSFSGEEVSLGRQSSRDLDLDAGRVDPYAETPASALQDIAFKCGTKVEFRQALVSNAELQFSVEVWFAGEKIGVGIGRTRRDAQRLAAEESLMTLAEKYLLHLKPDSGIVHGDGTRLSMANDNGFISGVNPFGYQSFPKEEFISEPVRGLDRLEASKGSMGSISVLEELVEIDGQVLGKGSGLTWDEAKTQAAEKALGSLRSMLGQSQFAHKQQGSPRSLRGMPNKRLKPEFPRALQRMPSSAGYPKNASPVP